jgi:2-haloalkanoic acid dehalogenase type II
MKKLLIFDAYGTLISTGTGSVDSTRRILELQEQKIEPIEFYANWKKYHRKHIDECIATGVFKNEWEIFTEDLRCLYEDYHIHRPYQEDVKLMYESQFNRKVFDDVFETIKLLRRKYTVVIGSTADTYPLIKNMDDNGLKVDNIYTSELIKTYKPDKKFYQYILDNEKVSPNEAVFIGDTLKDDIIGPKQLGICTILINRKGQIIKDDILPDYQITDLSEILKIL